MARRIGACAVTLGLIGAAWAGLGTTLRPEGPTIAGRPAWWALPLLGGSLVAAAILVALLAAGRDDKGDGMLGGMLFGTSRASLAVAGGADLLLGGSLLAADAGVLPDNARFVGLAASDWGLYAAASLLALLLATLGLCAWAWSAGLGTRGRKSSAAMQHAVAALLALAPWAIRAFFGT